MPGILPPTPLPDFVGRAAEIQALERRYASSRAALIPVYGRPRIGKTALLLRFAVGKPTVYYLARDRLPASQLNDFLHAAADWLGAAHLAQATATNWTSALRLVLDAAPRDRKLLLVLDEFQWLCRASPEFPSLLQQWWDLEWQHGNRLMLVLCGSDIGLMERQVLGARAPLYGRRTGDLRMEPFSYPDARAFHPGWSTVEQARAYFVCGGIPAYLTRFDADMSVTQNIARELFQIDGYFQREPDFLLREDFAQIRQAASILEAVGRGRQTQKDIAKAVGMTPSALAPHLKNLVSLGYLERVTPLTPKDSARPAVAYRIADNFLRFWFRFIRPHESVVPRYTGAQAFEQLVAPHWESFCGVGFERLCRDALPHLYMSEGVTGRFRVGEYWSRNAQLDVVGVRPDGGVDLEECRWPSRARVAEAARELSERAAAFPAGKCTVRELLFFRERPKSAPPGLRVYDLEDLYAAGP